MELFDKFEFIRNFGLNLKNTDEKLGIWHLLQRMDELNDYIVCVESMQECLTQNPVESEGLKGFKEYVGQLYNDAGFGANTYADDVASFVAQEFVKRNK